MKKTISLLLAILLCLGLTPPAHANNQPFDDVPLDHWAYDAILEAYNDGVMTGTSTRAFNPSGKLDVGQFATVLTRAFYNNDVLNSTRSGDWPNQNIDAAEKHNLFNGIVSWMSYWDTTRETMAQMMYNVMVDQSAILPNENEIQSTLSKIPDISDVDSSYRTAVAVCYYLDLLSGVDTSGTFAPKGVLNRAQTAVIYVRLKNAVKLLSDEVPAASITIVPDVTSPDPIPTQGDTGATLTNGNPVTEENVLALIEEYRNGKEPGEKAREAGFTSYTQGSEYDAYNPRYPIVLPDEWGNAEGTECAKFAFAFFDDIFGANAPIRKGADPANVRPGDLLHFPGHWAIATTHAYDYKGRGPHTQVVDGGSTGTIAWGNVNKTLSDNVEIYTRYPLPWVFEQESYQFSVTNDLGTPLSSLGLDSEAHLYASKDGKN